MNDRQTGIIIPNYSKDQIKLDNFIIIVLLFSGWSCEWTVGRLGELGDLILYIRLMLYPIFFGYYFLVRRYLKSSYAAKSDTIIIQVLLFLFICIVLGERIENNFFNTYLLWKEYYFLALLPFWAIIGFDIGGNIKRVYSFLYKLARIGAFLSYLSLAMLAIGISDESLIGPTHWAFRFIIVFSFIYFLTLIVTGINGGKSRFFWLLGSSLAVFWGFYKFTIVSVFIGILVVAALVIIKGHSVRRRSITMFFVLIMLLIMAALSINRVTGGGLFSVINNIYINKWLHGVDISEPLTPEDLNQLSAGRYKMWENALNRINEHPLLGSGLGQRYEGSLVTHNGYIDMLLSFGKLGSAIFLFAVLIWLIRLARSQTQKDILVIHVICVGYIFTIFAANLFGSIWIQYFTISFYTALLGGISYRLCSERKKI